MRWDRMLLSLLFTMLLMMTSAPTQLCAADRWQHEYGKTGDGPLGLAVFDKVMSETMPNGYSTRYNSFQGLLREDSLFNVIVISDYFSPTKSEINAMKKLLRNGVDIMIVACTTHNEDCNRKLYDSFGMSVTRNNTFRDKRLADFCSKDDLSAQTDVMWTDSLHGYPSSMFTFPTTLVGGYVKTRQQSIGTLASVDMFGIVYATAACRKIGDGRIYFVANPSLFSNYGILEDSFNPYVFRLMSQISRRPVVRLYDYQKMNSVEASNEESSPSRSPLSYFMSQPPLRDALIITAIIILSFMLFNMRRRQRPIPSIPVLGNPSLDFVRHVGTLYYRRARPHDLLMKKYVCFNDRLRQMLDIDIDDASQRKTNILILSARTGLSHEDVDKKITRLLVALDSGGTLTMDEMRQSIDDMSKIQRKL